MDEQKESKRTLRLCQGPKKAWETILTSEKHIPKMVFSVIGDSNNYVPKPWRTSVFQRALIDASQNAGDTWIIFRGYKDGVSKIIMDAYTDYIRSQFWPGEPSDDFSKKQVRIRLIKLHMKGDKQSNQDSQTYQDAPKYFSEQQALNPALKKFLQKKRLIRDFSIVHDETGDFDITSFHKFVVEFESYASTQWGLFFNFKGRTEQDIRMKVPVLLVVIEGDLETIKHTAMTVEKNIPVVLVKGSGKATDLIVKCIERGQYDEGIVRLYAPIFFGIKLDADFMEILGSELTRLVKNRHLLHIFDVDSHDPLKLSKIIGEAIVRAWAIEKTQRSSDISNDANDNATERYFENENGSTNKALSFVGIKPEQGSEYVRRFAEDKRPHVLNTQFLSPASLPLYFYVGYQVIQTNRNRISQSQTLLLEALKSNRSDYAFVLLRQGISLSIEDLPNLYTSTVGCKTCDKNQDCLHMSWILRQANKEAAGYLCTETKETPPEKVIKNARILVITILGYIGSEKSQGMEEPFVRMSDLLLWSIFANRPDLSGIFWQLSYDHLATALVCTALLKRLSLQAENVKEHHLSKSLTEHAKLFSERSIRMLDVLYKEDSHLAMKIVGSEAIIWDIKTNPLTFAHENFEMDFIGSTCPQRKLNQIWYNGIAPDFIPFLKSMWSKRCQFICAPITRFLVNYFLFLLMLIAFSAFVMTSIDDISYKRPIARVWEYYIYIWASGDLIEEIRNGIGIFTTSGRSHRGYWSRTKRYLNDFWNAVDLLSYVLLLLALLTRHLIESHPYTIARRLFASSLLLMYLRYLQLFLMNRRLGPTLIMIKEMLKDLLHFLIIAFVFIIGAGTYYHANLYPSHINLVGPGTWNTWHIWKIFYFPYWQLYGGDTFNEFLEDEPNCTSNRSLYEVNSDFDRCAEKDPTVPMVSAAYMLISNLLLVNLVIAMFTYTFNSVMANSEMLWRFERYTVITDYEAKIPSPFNFVVRPFMICRYIWQKIKEKKGKIEPEKETDYSNEHKRHIQRMIASRLSIPCDNASHIENV